jgi:endonuclease/exonuclease/phosphatase family metal-dependent hydrolase
MIVVGDFNASPAEPAYARMREAGFRSGSPRRTVRIRW